MPTVGTGSTYDWPMAARLPGRSKVVRVLFSAAALLIAGWLLVSWQDERLQRQGILLLAQQPPNTAAATDRFERARLLSVSLQPDQFIAATVYLSGDHAGAEKQLRALLVREPENRTSWLLLANWLLVDDPVAGRQALEVAARLDGRITDRAP